ncbi:unnamed protein product [Amoebophrya sp. A25]|nr:unnamed protein product [Amoebophrya sp. A25]|eukprot:GSA25T00025818001.1
MGVWARPVCWRWTRFPLLATFLAVKLNIYILAELGAGGTLSSVVVESKSVHPHDNADYSKRGRKKRGALQPRLNLTESMRLQGRYERCNQMVKELTEQLVGPLAPVVGAGAPVAAFLNPSDLQKQAFVPMCTRTGARTRSFSEEMDKWWLALFSRAMSLQQRGECAPVPRRLLQLLEVFLLSSEQERPHAFSAYPWQGRQESEVLRATRLLPTSWAALAVAARTHRYAIDGRRRWEWYQVQEQMKSAPQSQQAGGRRVSEKSWLHYALSNMPVGSDAMLYPTAESLYGRSSRRTEKPLLWISSQIAKLLNTAEKKDLVVPEEEDQETSDVVAQTAPRREGGHTAEGHTTEETEQIRVLEAKIEELGNKGKNRDLEEDPEALRNFDLFMTAFWEKLNRLETMEKVHARVAKVLDEETHKTQKQESQNPALKGGHFSSIASSTQHSTTALMLTATTQVPAVSEEEAISKRAFVLESPPPVSGINQGRTNTAREVFSVKAVPLKAQTTANEIAFQRPRSEAEDLVKEMRPASRRFLPLTDFERALSLKALRLFAKFTRSTQLRAFLFVHADDEQAIAHDVTQELLAAVPGTRHVHDREGSMAHTILRAFSYRIADVAACVELLWAHVQPHALPGLKAANFITREGGGDENAQQHRVKDELNYEGKKHTRSKDLVEFHRRRAELLFSENLGRGKGHRSRGRRRARSYVGPLPADLIRKTLEFSGGKRYNYTAARIGSRTSYTANRRKSLLFIGASSFAEGRDVDYCSQYQNILLVEPLPDAFRRLEQHIGVYQRIRKGFLSKEKMYWHSSSRAQVLMFPEWEAASVLEYEYTFSSHKNLWAVVSSARGLGRGHGFALVL